MKKLSLLLATLLTVTLLVACGSESTSKDTSSIDSSAGTQDDELSGEHSGVPTGTDLEGETIHIWYTTKAASVAETFVDIAGELTDETLDDAIYNANRTVEERLNCTLDYYNAGVSTSATGDVVSKLIFSDDTTYDLFHVVQWNAAQLAAEGMYKNLYDAPYFRFDQPWWDEEYMSALAIGNERLYLMVGDFAVDRTRCLGCVFYNKSLYEDFYQDGNALYQEVLDHTWTWDRMQQISAEVYSDVNNNGKADLGDRLGYAINDYNNIEILYSGSGINITDRDEDGNPYLVLNSERTADIFFKLYSMVYETEGAYAYSSVYDYQKDVLARDAFVEGNAMFQFGFFYTAEAMREMKDDYGIVPTPLFDEEQENYHSATHNIVRMMAVPANCTKFDSVCAVMEELAFEGYQTICPAYYDVLLKYKYARDDASAAMIDLIRDGALIDIADVYYFRVVSPDGMIRDKSNDFASKYAANEAATKERIKTYIEKFNDIE